MTFGQAPWFTAKWRRLGLSDEDLQALEAMIMNRPEAGPVMSGTGGLRKIRFAPPSWNRGKSGAMRVCYVWFVDFAHCYLATLFTKSEKDDLSAAEKAEMRRLVAQIRQLVEKGF